MSKITVDYVNSRIVDVKYIYEDLVTFCIITFDNKFKVTGEALCAERAWYDKDLGETIAFENAIDKSIGHFVFAQKEDYFTNA